MFDWPKLTLDKWGWLGLAATETGGRQAHAQAFLPSENRMAVSSASMETWVLDANVLIKGHLPRLLSNARPRLYYTLPEVLALEVRDADVRLQIEPYLPLLNVQTPSSASLSWVSAFAKLTGDDINLSLTDIRLIALAMDLEKESVGHLNNIRKEPLPVSNFLLSYRFSFFPVLT